MTKLGRFLRLERARPEGEPIEPAPHIPERFAGIEAPREQPAPREGEPDPFAPPPETEVRLELAEEPRREQHQAERRARAEAQLAATRQEIAVREESIEHRTERQLGVLGQMSMRDRVLIVSSTGVACLVIGELWRPWIWIVFPIVLAVIGATAFARRTD